MVLPNRKEVFNIEHTGRILKNIGKCDIIPPKRRRRYVTNSNEKNIDSPPLLCYTTLRKAVAL